MADVEETIDAVKRVQEFDVDQLPRREALGKALAFDDAIPPARRLIGFYRQIPLQHLEDVPASQLDQILNHANAFFNVLQAILNFDPAKEGNPNQSRQQLIDQLNAAYDSHFNTLFLIVSYLSSRQQDFSALEHRARAATQAAEDQADILKRSLEASEVEAQRILDEVRRTAAEHGVSQQAHYFQEEAKRHEDKAANWQKYTVRTSIGLGVFAGLSLVIGQWILIPDTPYEAFQVGLSKVLIFATIAFMLFQCVRTLMAHRHNAVVNKHRQNALLTFNALVDAAKTSETQDIVLTHASSCIFAPQESGFSKGATDRVGSPLVEILPRIAGSSGQG